MPSKSPAQHRLMAAVAHDPAFARKVGIKPSVGRDFMAADDAAGITKKPTMPRAQIAQRLSQMQAKGSPRSPARGLDRRTKAHRQSVRDGDTHPASHSEFERLGS